MRREVGWYPGTYDIVVVVVDEESYERFFAPQPKLVIWEPRQRQKKDEIP